MIPASFPGLLRARRGWRVFCLAQGRQTAQHLRRFPEQCDAVAFVVVDALWEQDKPALSRGYDFLVAWPSDFTSCHSNPALSFHHVTHRADLLLHRQGDPVSNLKRGGHPFSYIMHHGMGHDFIKDSGHYTAVHDIMPSLEFSLQRKLADRFFLKIGNLHVEANRVQRAAGKAISIVGEFLLRPSQIVQFFSRSTRTDLQKVFCEGR